MTCPPGLSKRSINLEIDQLTWSQLVKVHLFFNFVFQLAGFTLG